MWERLTAPEDGFSKLQRENLAIVHSYGTTLMEVVCRDACDGHQIGRVGNTHTHTEYTHTQYTRTHSPAYSTSQKFGQDRKSVV